MTPRCCRSSLRRALYRCGFFELITEILIGLFEAFPMTAAVAEGGADDEAEGGG